jgi:NAD(P)-dependent dehydrogenase (short-subunit alcohol dehydrogenase family)
MPHQDTTIVLVTGANQGIGFEISKSLAAKHPDYHVIMAGRRKEAIEEAAAGLKKTGLDVEPLVMDLNSDESIASAVEYVDSKFGHLDVLVNNCGISRGPTENMTLREEFTAIYNTNVFGTAVVTETFIPLLAKSEKTKRIVFLGSSIGSLTMKADPKSAYRGLDWRQYASSKTAGHYVALTYAARFDGDPSWKINISNPGYCATNLNDFSGADTSANGAVDAVRLAELGLDGETGTFSSREGPVPW